MQGREESVLAAQSRIYCLIPRDLAPKLHELLRRHFRDDSSVEVVVEFRRRERRSGSDRRVDEASAAERPATMERRRIRNRGGRRVGERRSLVAAVAAPAELPRKARAHVERLLFVERHEPSDERAEDLDTARLVTRLQAGDQDLFSLLYVRYFDRVYSYLRLVLRDVHEAEDLSQQVFVRLLEALGGYELRGQPFRSWMFAIVRHQAIDYLRASRRLDVTDPSELADRCEAELPASDGLSSLGWITDSDLLIFVERLPVVQRQVLLLRYMLDLSIADTARILDLSPNDVKGYQHRATSFLRQRLAAIGRTTVGRHQGVPMRRCFRPASVLRRRRFVLR